MIPTPLAFIPFLVFLVWLALFVYAIQLATRFVKAVEQIARSFAERPPDRPQP
jgi:hypothetical protein